MVPLVMTNKFLKALLFFAGCTMCGWVSAFAMPHVSFWPCLFLGLSGYYWLYTRTNTAGGAFLSGLCFALGYFVTGLWWIGNALLVEGNEFAWVWPISVIGLPTLLGLFTGTYVAIARISGDPKTLKGFFLFVFFLTFSEWARGHAFSGFPWNLYGYVWSDHITMAQISHYIGAYGLTLLTVAWAALCGFLLTQKRTPAFYGTAIALLIVTMLSCYGFGAHRLSSNPTTYDNENAVLVVQPNIAQNMKWDPVALQENFLKITSLSKGADFADPALKNIFIVWPETAVSPSIYNLQENTNRIRNLLSHYKGVESYLITGILRRTEKAPNDFGSANSVIVLDKNLSPVDIYDKYHLVPFGEFIPLQDWIPLKPVAAFRGFERGFGAATIATNTIPAFSPLICYEVIFPDDVVAKQGQRPLWIVNVTNDGWYGDSAGPYQHFAQTRLRAIEEGLPVIRSANTGISGIIDPYGRIIEKADIFDEATLVSKLPESIPGRSPYWPWAFQIILAGIGLGIMFATLVLKKQKSIYPKG